VLETLARRMLLLRYMMGDLTGAEIEDLLRRGRIGRIGCHAEGRTYIVPIAYAYDGECVVARSADGLKIRTMRANPAVCFEVDEIQGIDDWRSVIAWGTYEELWGSALESASRLLRAHLVPGQPEAGARPAKHEFERGDVFRLRLATKTGRFERP
jgi:nitroimidazol reductase NimA-like FMN-containing flavoprotein (pyridoxamine 5'-phosphate oxidase superfamily)